MERAKYATVLCCSAGRKHGRKTEQQNGLSEQFKLCGFFSLFLASLFQQQSLKRFFSVGYNNGFVDIIFVFRAGLSNRYVRSLDEAVGRKLNDKTLEISGIINPLFDGLTFNMNGYFAYHSYFPCSWLVIRNYYIL